jgi:hypothetical protein
VQRWAMLLAALLLLLLPTAASAALRRQSPHQNGVPRCSSAADCNYNGACTAAGECRCTAQWSGSACATLRRLPASKHAGFCSPHGGSNTTAAGRTSSWGGSILQDEKTKLWHMFSAQMINDCGIGSWEPNSRVVHATASSYEGPYTFSDVVAVPFAHEPNAVRAPSGEWYTIIESPCLGNCMHSDSITARTCAHSLRPARPAAGYLNVFVPPIFDGQVLHACGTGWST